MEHENEPNIIVAGFGRCGTTAMMNMLWCGGAKVAGRPPAFEDKRTALKTFDVEWVRAQRGRAVKLVLYGNTPKLVFDQPAKIIWMDRSFNDQARSQAKFVQMLDDNPHSAGTRPDIKGMARTMRKERPIRMAAFRKVGEVMPVRFKDLLKYPDDTAKRVQGFLGAELFPDWRQGARAILPRSHLCAPDLRVEEALLEAVQSLGFDEEGAMV